MQISASLSVSEYNWAVHVHVCNVCMHVCVLAGHNGPKVYTYVMYVMMRISNHFNLEKHTVRILFRGDLIFAIFVGHRPPRNQEHNYYSNKISTRLCTVS
jgi:hypothetical protein